MMNACNAWIAIGPKPIGKTPSFPDHVLRLDGSPNLFSAIAEGDWILAVMSEGTFARAGRVLRLRAETDSTTVYFDRLVTANEPVAVSTAGLSVPEKGSVSRLQWNAFAESLTKLIGKGVDDVPLIEHQAYIRELLQLAVTDDLLGPANGPHEQIVDMGVRDRYLVGKLAPMESNSGGIEGLEGPLAAEADEGEPGDLDVHKGRHEPGAEFDGATGRVDAEAEALDEIDAASNQSLVPSSFGMTFCVDGDVDSIEIAARWGRYERDRETEIYKTRDEPGHRRGRARSESEGLAANPLRRHGRASAEGRSHTASSPGSQPAGSSRSGDGTRQERQR